MCIITPKAQTALTFCEAVKKLKELGPALLYAYSEVHKVKHCELELKSKC